MTCLLFKKLALRNAFVVTLILLLTGSLVVKISMSTIATHESSRIRAEQNTLLDTVEDMAKTAVFLGDRELAADIIEGLLSSEMVAHVELRWSEGELAKGTRKNIEDYSNFNQHSRELHSPFESDRVMGEIILVSNDLLQKNQIRDLTWQTGRYQFLLVLVIGLSVILTTHMMVVRPITRLSARLHSLRVELGEKLVPPKGHDGDEISRLTQDINSMIDHLVSHINKEKSLRLEKEANEERLRNIFENAHSGLALCSSDGRLLSCNPAFGRYFNIPHVWESEEPRELAELVSVLGQSLLKLVSDTTSDGRHRRIQITLPHNRKRWLEIVATPNQDGNVEIICNDITELKEASSAAETMATTDALTGLGNRLGFERYFQSLTKPEPLKPQISFALLYMDLDFFKEVNDTYGHKAGDVVLQKFGRILLNIIRQSDYIARLGGDEFALVLENVGKPSVATGIAATLLEQLRQPILLDNNVSARIGASIGIAFGKSGNGGADKLIEEADSAMYRAKQEGRNRYCLATDLSV